MKNWKIKGRVNIDVRDFMLNKLDSIINSLKYIDEYYRIFDYRSFYEN